MIGLRLYTRPGCHLCDDMKAIVSRVAARVPLTLEEVDISRDPDLESRYGQEIPVLEMDGKKIAKYRIGETDLMRVLAGKAEGAG